MYCKIVKVGIQIGCSIGVCMSLSGCFEKPKPNIPEFQPKALSENARGITMASSKAYHCKIVGEMEGHDEVRGKVSNVTRERIRQGAINDLKNELTYAIKDGQKVMIHISREQMKCRAYPVDKKGKVIPKSHLKEMDCTDWEDVPEDRGQIISYKVYADLYDCGDKQIH
ncbi:MAG: hypothetical protein SPJ16_02740 [Helicobacter sp.]|uniref:hypothetical protein n=1 Tax=Helicobacter sp. TaxID=218 RepID=UPI002A9121D0|nr:hypothetical protein [Helicobacter sp.]MDY5950099.1 hypothetical protein [Helicobacter sp.]